MKALHAWDLKVSLSGRTIIDGYSAQWPRGVSALVGVNGTGKTTLMRAVVGILPRQRGAVTFGSPGSQDPTEPTVRYAPQHSAVTRTLTALQLLTYTGLLDGLPTGDARRAGREALARVGLENESGVKTSHLSGGMAKRLGIATALVGSGDALMLDEPTSGLDPVQRREVMVLIEALGRTMPVVFSTHYMEEVVAVASHFSVLSEGREAAGGPVQDMSVVSLEALVADSRPASA